MEKCCMPVVKFYLAKIYSQWRNTMWTSSIRKVSEVLDWGESFHNQTVHMFTQFGYIWEFVKHSPNTRLWHCLNVETDILYRPTCPLFHLWMCFLLERGDFYLPWPSCSPKVLRKKSWNALWLDQALLFIFLCSCYTLQIGPSNSSKYRFRLGFLILYTYNHPGGDSHLRRLKSTASRFLVGILRVPEPPHHKFCRGLWSPLRT